jgi:hypothetical protein
MKAYEISKHGADIPRGTVLMAIEGGADAVEAISDALSGSGYPSTNCAEVGDKEGEIVEFFVIARANKAEFISFYKSFK